MTTAPPKAIKAFVSSTIKESLLESKTDYSENVETPFIALFKMELVTRGVLVSLKDDDISQL